MGAACWQADSQPVGRPGGSHGRFYLACLSDASSQNPGQIRILVSYTRLFYFSTDFF